MTAEKKPLTEEEREEARRREKELMDKLLAAHPGIMPPTGGKDARVFNPIKTRKGKPLSETVIEMRRC